MVNVHKAIPGEVRGGRSWRAATLRNSRANRSGSRFAVRRRRSSLSPSALPHVRHPTSSIDDALFSSPCYVRSTLPITSPSPPTFLNADRATTDMCCPSLPPVLPSFLLPYRLFPFTHTHPLFPSLARNQLRGNLTSLLVPETLLPKFDALSALMRRYSEAIPCPSYSPLLIPF